MGRTVFILGAGASHGAGFTCYKNVKPPLIKDFFRIFDNFNYFGKDHVKIDLLDFLLREFNWSEENLLAGRPNIEEIIDQIDQSIEKIGFKENLERYRKYYSSHRDLIDFIVEALHRSTWQPIGGFAISPYLVCPYHDNIANFLSQRDFIISLNYDLIMEISLMRIKNWNYLTGYGLPFQYYSEGNEWKELKNDAGDHYYFKLHGSLNWFNSTGYVGYLGGAEETRSELRVEPKTKNVLHLLDPISWYRNERRFRSILGANINTNSRYRYVLERLIVGPGKNKSVEMFSPIWFKAAKRLKDVDKVFIIGCSLRENDNKLIDLLRDNIKWGTLEKFILVDPSEDVRRRYEKCFGRKIDVSLNDMEELSEYLSNFSKVKVASDASDEK